MSHKGIIFPFLIVNLKMELTFFHSGELDRAVVLDAVPPHCDEEMTPLMREDNAVRISEE